MKPDINEKLTKQQVAIKKPQNIQNTIKTPKNH